MKILRRFLIVALGGLVLLSAAPVQAGPNLSLSEEVKAGLLAGEPVLGRGVGRETFNGKPVLVTFFASW